jgi:CRISPR-associated protein Cas5t
MVGVQPSFFLPPPSTIYGHICSTVGDLVDPLPDGKEPLAFAYHFTYQGVFEDLEHIHVLEASSGYLPGTTFPKVAEGFVNPYRRMLLFRPHLILYINRPEWERAFQEPHYCVAFGRSQDLATYTGIEVINLEEHQDVYFEHTLLPYEMANETEAGIVVLMPRWVDLAHHRESTFARYVLLQEHITTQECICFQKKAYPTDPFMPSYLFQGQIYPLGLCFHRFQEPKL